MVEAQSEIVEEDRRQQVAVSPELCRRREVSYFRSRIGPTPIRPHAVRKAPKSKVMQVAYFPVQILRAELLSRTIENYLKENIPLSLQSNLR